MLVPLLYMTKKIAWYHSATIADSLPIAAGPVEPEVAAKLIALDESQLRLVLQNRQIPDVALHYAILRLRSLKDAIRNGERLEKIVRDNRILMQIVPRQLTLLMGHRALDDLAIECLENSLDCQEL